MPNYRLLILTLLCGFVGLALPRPSYAEGGCPPGMYPIGGQGVTGCAPMDGGGGGRSPMAQASGRWLKTWGAVADSLNGLTFPVTGGRSKSSASKKALDLCKSHGGEGCSIAFTYKNQCYALIRTSPGRGDFYVGEATAPQAREAGVKECRETGGTICEVLHSECTDPIFIAH